MGADAAWVSLGSAGGLRSGSWHGPWHWQGKSWPLPSCNPKSFSRVAASPHSTGRGWGGSWTLHPVSELAQREKESFKILILLFAEPLTKLDKETFFFWQRQIVRARPCGIPAAASDSDVINTSREKCQTVMSLREGVQPRGRTSAAGTAPAQDPVSNLAASSLCFGAGSRPLPRGSGELRGAAGQGPKNSPAPSSPASSLRMSPN